ncbi:hypothetical protein Cal7507_1360 [Calothrix sp. PCC 7507]|nr:hypothetical protein Cal7507_1360 [Calothrix sp. PCC 7507]
MQNTKNIVCLIATFLFMQLFSSLVTANNQLNNYVTEKNINYHTVNNNQLKLNLYQNKKPGEKHYIYFP